MKWTQRPCLLSKSFREVYWLVQSDRRNMKYWNGELCQLKVHSTHLDLARSLLMGQTKYFNMINKNNCPFRKKFHYQYICIPLMIWSSEIWQKSLYLRNSKHCILYVGNFKWKNVQVEITYSLEACTRDVKTIVKVTTRENAALSWTRVLKCTNLHNFNRAIGHVLANFELSQFLPK